MSTENTIEGGAHVCDFSEFDGYLADILKKYEELKEKFEKLKSSSVQDIAKQYQKEEFLDLSKTWEKHLEMKFPEDHKID